MQNLTTDSSQDNLFCLANLSQHQGILHSTLFAAQAFHDLSLGGSYGTIARFHLAKAITHLQQSLDNKDEALQPSTMAVVTSLAMATVIAGDLKTAAKHMDGLHRIIQLRGGLGSLGTASMIEHKARAQVSAEPRRTPFYKPPINSLDLGLNIAPGSELRFGREDAISWSCQIARRPASGRYPELDAALQLHPRPDPRLLNVWADLREFCRIANDATNKTGTRVTTEVCSKLAASVPERLVRLRNNEDGPSSSLGELLRLCMLALVTMLLIRLRGIGAKMTFLADGLRHVLLAHCSRSGSCTDRRPTVYRKLVLWGLFVADMSVFGDSNQGKEWLDEMLARTASELGLRDWAETRAVLKEFLWVDAACDGAGRQILERRSWVYAG